MRVKKYLGFLSVAIFASIGIGILSMDFISTNAQTSESTSNEVLFVFDPSKDLIQQDCIDMGGAITFNYDASLYQCIRG